MDIDPTTLFLLWFGGGFVIFLAWAALVGQALMGARPGVVRPSIAVLAVLGLVHPAAALSAIDLTRLARACTRPVAADLDDPVGRERARALALPGWAMIAVGTAGALSAVVAVAAFVSAGGLP